MIKAQFYKQFSYHKQTVRQHPCQKILWSCRPALGMGMWLTPWNTSFPHLVKFGRSKSNGMSVIEEKWPLASRLSRSLEIIGTDPDRSATYDFLLVFYSNYGSVSYRFLDKRRYRSKIAYFTHPNVFNAPVEGVPLEFCNISSAQNTRMVESLWGKVHSFRYNTTMWRTDGRTWLLKQYRALHTVQCAWWRAIKQFKLTVIHKTKLVITTIGSSFAFYANKLQYIHYYTTSSN